MSKKLQVGICSFGMSGRVFHCPLLHTNPGFEIKKILQRSSDSAKEYYPYADIVKSKEALLDDHNIDLIIVNTPDTSHYELTKQALEAGKHVVVEKPFITNVREGMELIELAKKKNKLLSIFQNRRWDGDFLTVQHIVQQKLLGRLVEFESHFDRYRNYIKPNTWKENPGSDTGVLYNLGSHLIDQAIVLFGKPKSVWADIDKVRTNTKVDDYFYMKLEYPSVKITLHCSYLTREPGPKYLVHGTEGSYVKYGLDPQEEALDSGRFPDEPDWGKEPEDQWGILNTTIKGKDIREKMETLAGNYSAYYNNIYEVIVHGAELIVKPEESLLGIEIIEAAKESNLQKKSFNLK
ncbi:MAG: oxidoreductase [Bacteroidales bacterium]|nr:oxidoreductase [Bacteroidales bacterium]